MSTSTENLEIFVGNLTSDTDVEKLTTLFGQAGTVVHAELITLWDTALRFGSVTMSTVEEVEKAIKKFDVYGLNGNYLSVSKYDPRKSQPDLPKRPLAFDSAFSLYVCNLTRETDPAKLEEIFSKYGKVKSVEFVTDSYGRSRGYGFVTMSSKTEMDDAIAALDRKLEMGSRTMHVAELPRNL
ncbi:RNA-binding protein CP31B, chloroplastic-like [Vicia villosa]|uniref:RNA-binding protein CP31B, chloroplastic-like n=1 Tax=Vicia villosa TaxID=3911 RepID=UPI00273CE918|nr:RNA-binding protein CP31B, chloroplastic-like [Vicia villosa]